MSSVPKLRRKQVSLYFPIDRWLRLRAEAARRGLPLTELLRRYMQPELDALEKEDGAAEREA